MIQPKKLCQDGKKLTGEKKDYKKMVAVHTAVSVGAMLLLYLVDLLCGYLMSDMSGLSSMGKMAVLKTIPQVLSLAVSVAQIFFTAGLWHLALQAARGERSSFSRLTAGFFRLGPLFRYHLMLGIFGLLVCALSLNVTPLFAMAIPVPQELQQILQQVDEDTIQSVSELLEMLPLEACLTYFIGVSAVFLAVCGGAGLLLRYRFLMAGYLLMDNKGMGAMAALSISSMITKGNRTNLLKLDLRFWWYYLLQFLLSLLPVLPLVWELAGLPVPMAMSWFTLLCYGVYGVLSIGLAFFAGARRHAALALAYEQLKQHIPSYNRV